MNKNILYKRKNRKGFTLAELLMTVAILLIVFALAVPAIFAIQRNLRQKELDSKAEIIYTAVQDKLTELYSKGQTSKYDPNQHTTDIYSIGSEMPGDYEVTTLDKVDSNGNVAYMVQSIYYFTSDSALGQEIIGSDVLSDDLKNGHWVVEYIPYAAYESDDRNPNTTKLTSATVYGVYYSEDYEIQEKGNTYSYANEDSTITEVYRTGYPDGYREKDNRKDKNKGDARIGYYGGSTAGSGSDTSKIELLALKINSSDEINTAEVKVKAPSANMKDFKIYFTFKDDDKDGHSYTIEYIATNVNGVKENRYLVNGATMPDNLKGTYTENPQVGGSSVYSFKFVLDDLSSEKTRFKSLYGSESGHNYNAKGEKISDSFELTEGANLQLTVSFDYSDHRIDQPLLKERTKLGNSLFDFSDAKNATDKYFSISNGRHLQNLDYSSNCKNAKVATAYLTGNVNLGKGSTFAETYKDYFNGTMNYTDLTIGTGETVPDFKSVSNSPITKFDGKKYTISGLSTTGRGMFDTINGSSETTISNVKLTGERVFAEKGTAGGLIGSVNNNALTINNVHVYLDKDNGDISSDISSEENMEAYRWIVADNTTGGLIGINNGKVTINNSSVSTVLGNDTSVTGGLIGLNKGNATVNTSYTDNYAYGKTVAGIVGDNEGTVTVNSSYTSGFIGVYGTESKENKGAGFVTGKTATVTDSYTVIAPYNIADDGGLSVIGDVDTVDYTYYRTVENGNADSVYFLRDSKNVYDANKNDNAIKIGKVDNIKLSANFKTVVSDKKASVPYMLLGKSLTNFPYPMLDMEHYGDWTAEYEAGALVYYEIYRYTDENGNDIYSLGFDGANLDVTLIRDYDVVGDGYGVLYKADATDIPAKVSAEINGIKVDNILDVESEKTAVNGVEYNIYPLSKDIVNPNTAITDFYERISLTAKSNDNSVISTKFYDFNPHFARTVRWVTDKESVISTLGTTITIRSPRQLYNLSKYYDGYRTIVEGKTFKQERNMVYSTYEWTNYTNENNTVTKQAPIGASDATTFTANYDGGCYRIGDISFYTENGSYAGMFGYTKGDISNVFLLTQYSTDAKQVYRVEREKAVNQNETFYAGILAGRNEGNITNCAVAGYYVAQSTNSTEDGTIHGYQNSTLYIGGFVGYNSGEIRNCSSDNPKLSLKMTDANCYAGGFVGYNTGKALINNCYALISIDGNATGGYTNISGFAAYNSSEIRNSYCASALTASGEATKAYAFGSNEGNGIESSDYYLSQGSYRFAGKLYAYGRSEMNGSSDTEAGSTGTPMLYEELAARKPLSPATIQDYFAETKKADDNQKEYPFRAVVRNVKGEYVHYGEWTVEPVLGTYGLFYWEHENYGQNNGYKFTYVGVVSDNIGDTIYTESTLCDSHDDGGIITEYGYGYYVSNKDGLTATVNSQDISGLSESSIDINAKTDLEKQVPGIEFYPYTTYTENGNTANNKLYLSSGGQNGNLTLTVTNTKNNITKMLNYTVSPFFANAFSLKTDNLDDFSVSSESDKQYLDKTPGIAEADGKNSYEIRSIQQLQYINWNDSTKSTSSLVSMDNYKYFNYLMFTSNTNTSKQNKTQAGRYNEVENIVFSQSHDLNAKDVKNYVPIACTSTSSTVGGYDAILYAWFGSTYDGQSYKIQELSISSNGYAVGLFGVTVGADLKNIIMYSGNSTKKAVIERKTDLENDTEKLNNKAGAYSIGGLVGVAYDYASPVNRTITNCSIAGYIIRDESKNQLTLGESNVGGLIGVSNVNVDGCSAVVDIQENASHLLTDKLEDGISIAKYGNYIRVGGLCGAVQNKVTRSYTGGNITVGDTLLHETYATKNGNNTGTDYVEYGTEDNNKKASYEGSSHVFISGIAGSGFTMNYRNFSGSTGSVDGKPDVENCYSYVNFPTMEGTIRSISMITSVADRYGRYGEAKATIKNCYYLESSANLNYNLPYYYFSNNSSNSPARLYKWDDPKGKTSFDKLIDGDVRILYQIFNNTDGGVNRKVSIENESSISYASLASDEDWKNRLNKGLADDKKWSKVTIKDSKGNIDGKYSFNAGKSYLDGKNYPFPTIIKENDTINVHYGEWPTNGPYWSQGTATIDLISDLNGDVAEGSFTINKPYDESSYTVDFKYGENDVTSPYVYIDNVKDVKRENNTLEVTVHALKTGSQKITAVWTDKTTGEEVDEASFTLTVKCEFTVEADQRSLILGSGEEANVVLSAKNSKGGDIDTSELNFKWDKSVSRTLDSDVDDAGCSDIADNTMTVTGQGNDAVITVTGTYVYNNLAYQSSVRINVKKQEFIGISDNNTFNEMVADSRLIRNGVSYSDDNKPYLNGYSMYLYEYSTSQLIKNVELELVDSDGNVVDHSVVTCGEKITSGSYNYYPISVDTTGVDSTKYSDDLTNASIRVIKINNNEINGVDESGNVALLALNVSSVKLPQSIYFKDGDNTVAEPVKITHSVSKVDVNMKMNTPESYLLEGWYADTEGKVKVLEADGTVVSGNVDGYVTDGKLTFTSHTITLHPMWMRYVAIEVSDQSSLDENGQYIMVHFGTSKYATMKDKPNGYFRNAIDLDNNKFTFTSIGKNDSSVSYAISDYIYEANEIPQVTSDYIYQIIEDKLYRYVAPAINSGETEQ